MDNTIILVDDDPDFLDTLKKRLINSGFNKIYVEDDSIRAASLFEKGEIFDIALIDMTMPGIDGIELLEVIKSTSPNSTR